MEEFGGDAMETTRTLSVEEAVLSAGHKPKPGLRDGQDWEYSSDPLGTETPVSRAERNCTSGAERNCTTGRRGVSIKAWWSVRA